MMKAWQTPFRIPPTGKPRRRGLALRLGALSLAALLLGASLAPYHLERVLKLGGEGRWDYVALDSFQQLLYVPRQSHTQVVSTETGKLVADIKGTAGVHGVALAPHRHRGFTSNGEDGTSTVFDTQTQEVLGKVATAPGADCIIYDPSTKKVLTFSGTAEAMISFDANIDLSSGKADRPVALGGKPEYAVADGNGHVYVNLEDKNEVVSIDTKLMRVMAHWSLEKGEEPTGMSMDPLTHRLFIGCHNQTLVIMSSDNGDVVTTFPIGTGVDATAFDNGYVLVSCGDGTLTVVKEEEANRFRLVQNLQTARGARTMAVDTERHKIYLPTADLQQAAPGAAEQPHVHPEPIPGTFKVLVLSH
jgi:DNA-binding beta-propeller fold protein YncE